MNRYEFTTREGFRVGIVEAPTATEARQIADNRYGKTAALCSHLSGESARGRADAAYRQIMGCSQNPAAALAAYDAELAR